MGLHRKGVGMEREMRRKDRKVSDEKAWEMLETAEWGILSLASAGGEPYGVPLNYACQGECLYIHCAIEGKKIDIIKENDKASFCCVVSAKAMPEKFTTAYASAIAKGKVEVASDEDKRKALKLLIGKYCAGLEKEGLAYTEKLYGMTEVIKFSVESVSGKSNI